MTCRPGLASAPRRAAPHLWPAPRLTRSPARPAEALARQLCGHPAPRSPRGHPGCGSDTQRAGCRAPPPAAEHAPRLPGGAPASPRRHHHIVDDQVRRGHRPGALLLPRAAAVASPGSSTAAPIPFGRCSRRRCRHVKRLQSALLTRAPQTRLGTARGRREGRGGGGAAARGGARTAPTGPPSWMRAKTLQALPPGDSSP